VNTLRIYLFGGGRTMSGGQMETKMNPTIKALFAYLLLHRKRSHSREVLSSLFWGNQEEQKARRCLSTALWRLRNNLNCEGKMAQQHILTEAGGEIRFNPDCQYWLDVAEFEQKTRPLLHLPIASLNDTDAQTLEEAVALYKDDLLVNFYDDWAIRERERLRNIYLQSLNCLMQFYKSEKRFEKSIEFGRRILSLDPLRENVQRTLMRIYARKGQRNIALLLYQEYEELLAAELGIRPMKETQSLYYEIASGQPKDSHIVQKNQFNQAFIHLSRAIEELEKVRSQLGQIMQ
jgi:DNA-binding SARP family transcriptional activator